MRSVSLENCVAIQNSWSLSCIAASPTRGPLFSEFSMGEQKTKDNCEHSCVNIRRRVYATHNRCERVCRAPARAASSVPAIGEGMTDDLRLKTGDWRLQTNAVRASHPDRTVFAKSCSPLD